MEEIVFKYKMNETDRDILIKESRNSEQGLTVSEVCEMFMSFMESIGYNVEQIEKYFQE